jgi:hypothetical protein
LHLSNCPKHWPIQFIDAIANSIPPIFQNIGQANHTPFMPMPIANISCHYTLACQIYFKKIFNICSLIDKPFLLLMPKHMKTFA